MGPAPLEDSPFRRAVFEPLGDDRLEGAITADITGKPDAFALRLDETQRQQLSQSLKKAQRDLREAVWRSYKNIALLGRDNQIRPSTWGWCTPAPPRAWPS